MRTSTHQRGGFSLLELVVASSMLTLTLATVSTIMRTGHQTWEVHESNHARIQAAHATLRHIVRGVRQAERIEKVSEPGESSGQLTITHADGKEYEWKHDKAKNLVLYGEKAAAQILATNISALNFQGFQIDGKTRAVNPKKIQLLWVELTIRRPYSPKERETVGSWIWLRAW